MFDIRAVKFKVDAAAMAKAGRMRDVQSLIRVMKNPVSASGYVHDWMGAISGVMERDTTRNGADGFYPIEGGRALVAIRSFNSSPIQFQQSKNRGVNRPCTQVDLIETIAKVDYYLLADLLRFPEILFLPIPAEAFLHLAEIGKLKPSGMEPAGLDQWLKSRFRIQMEMMTDFERRRLGGVIEADNDNIPDWENAARRAAARDARTAEEETRQRLAQASFDF